MKKSIKAVLISALVFPGAGHIYLKRYFIGVLLAVASLGALYYLVSSTLEKAFEISEKIQSGVIPPDIESISGLVAQRASGADAQMINAASTVLIFCWILGIIDAYRAGRVQDKTVVR